MAHAQKPDFVFRRNGRIHLNRRGRQFSRLLAAEVCASEVVMLDTPCSEVVWRVLATHSIRRFPLHFPSRASPCAITFQLDSNSCCLHSSRVVHCACDCEAFEYWDGWFENRSEHVCVWSRFYHTLSCVIIASTSILEVVQRIHSCKTSSVLLKEEICLIMLTD